ncbi:hypothetical protein KIN20_030280 [Parelaphostrongylus tenuis]|uniref:Uncharacterized protein n=1 Tax=Parelaphostrongylus tenuis TaxID=148309 RepID=A0AAD5R3J0_PARTN|nr:hypothetical protein KIN20_030280 [Parelaphostrongylus tenuis]
MDFELPIEHLYCLSCGNVARKHIFYKLLLLWVSCIVSLCDLPPVISAPIIQWSVYKKRKLRVLKRVRAHQGTIE